jgi:hypothetical protein
MIGRGGSLRRAAAMSLRALSSAEASFSGRVSQGYPAARTCADEFSYTLQNPRLGWESPAPTGSRLLSSLEEAAAPEPRQATYHVEVITGDVRGAGSPAPAAITLFGEGKMIAIKNKVNFVIVNKTKLALSNKRITGRKNNIFQLL